MRRSNIFRVAGATAFAVALTSNALAFPEGNANPWPFDPNGLPNLLRPNNGQVGPAPRSNPGVTAPLVEAPKIPKSEAAPALPSQAEQLNELFGRLAKAVDADEASSIALLIQHLWLRSGSDTADLLMVRVVTALGKGKGEVATSLLDTIVSIDPTWAEAWNKRATLRFLAGDDDGSMQDIAHVLVLEPRHFGALSGMSFILNRHGMKKEALALLRKTEAIYPHNADLEKLTDQLSLEVEGRDL